MTTTRKYYDILIEKFHELTSIQQNEVIKYTVLKKDIINLVNRIEKFNLFDLTFSKQFKDITNKETIDDFVSEKISLTNEMYFELVECLWTTRLRYGGELMQYILRIKLGLLNLTIEELKLFEEKKKEPEHNLFPEKFIFLSENEKEQKIKELKSLLKNNDIHKRKVSLKQKDYLQIETKLQEYLSYYKEYIFKDYPEILDSFSYYNKKVRAYITEAMSKDIFEFRIHSYESPNGDASLKLENRYYDFYPSYFYNLEEIIEKQVGACVVSLNKEDFTFSNPFAKERIHHELLHIYFDNSNEKELISFLTFLLKLEGYKILKSSATLPFDIEAEKDASKSIYELFHHKPRSIETILKKISNLEKLKNEYQVNYVFSSYPGDEIIKLLKENQINSIFINHLTQKHFEVDNSDIIHWYIKSKLHLFTVTNNSIEKKFIGDNLIKKLELCEKGENSWPEYEKIGVEIFGFLFADNFKIYLAEEQVENDLRNHRRDLLVNNNFKHSASFWADMKLNYNSNAIIIDFKNYSKKLNSTNFFSVSKYTKKNVGNFAIVFSRYGIDDTAKKEQKVLFENGKLLLSLNDEDLKEMIREKMIGKDPN